jgi:hypothetical protein
MSYRENPQSLRFSRTTMNPDYPQPSAGRQSLTDIGGVTFR